MKRMLFDSKETAKKEKRFLDCEAVKKEMDRISMLLQEQEKQGDTSNINPCHN